MRKFLPLVLALVLMIPMLMLPVQVQAYPTQDIVITDTPTNLGCSSVTLNGHLTQSLSNTCGDDDYLAWFEYGTSPSNLNLTTPTVPGTWPATFSVSVSTLQPCTVYYARAVVSCRRGAAPIPTFVGNIISFDTLQCCVPPLVPIVTTDDPTNLVCTSVTLNASASQDIFRICGNGYALGCYKAWFEYGTSPQDYGNWVKTPEQIICSPDTTFSADIDLRPCTRYYARAVVSCVSRVLRLATGVGIDPVSLPGLLNTINYQVPENFYGNDIAFDTLKCCLSGDQTGGSSSGWTMGSTIRPFLPPMFEVQNATVAASKVAPGEQVDVTAMVTNKGGSNGTTKVVLYVNGQEADSKGVALSSGQSTPVSFKVSRNDPGTYSVYVNGVSAGSFTVDLFSSNDVLIYCSIAIFAIGMIGLLYYLMKRRTAA